MEVGDTIKIETVMGATREYRVTKVISDTAVKCVYEKSGNVYRFHIVQGNVQALYADGKLRHFGYIA